MNAVVEKGIASGTSVINTVNACSDCYADDKEPDASSALKIIVQWDYGNPPELYK